MANSEAGTDAQCHADMPCGELLALPTSGVVRAPFRQSLRAGFPVKTPPQHFFLTFPGFFCQVTSSNRRRRYLAPPPLFEIPWGPFRLPLWRLELNLYLGRQVQTGSRRDT